MRVLSLTQPWASLVAWGEKAIETRSWSTPYRGPLAIHASSSFPMEAREICRLRIFRESLEGRGIDVDRLSRPRSGYQPLPLGRIVALCALVEIHRTAFIRERIGEVMENGIAFTMKERNFGDFEPGRFAWVLADVQMLKNPIPYRGALGLREVWGREEEIILAQVERVPSTEDEQLGLFGRPCGAR